MAPGIYGSKLHSRVTAVTALAKLAASVDYSSQAYTPWRIVTVPGVLSCCVKVSGGEALFPAAG